MKFHLRSIFTFSLGKAKMSQLISNQNPSFQADSCQSWNQISTDLIKKVCTYIFLEELVDYFLYRERIIYLLIYRYSNSKLKSQKIMISVNVTHLQSKDLRKTQNCYRFFDYGFLCQMKTTHFFKDIYFLRN